MTIQTYLTNLCKHSGIDQEHVEIDVQEDDQYVKVALNLPADESGLFIGFHGDTLSSLQRLVRVIFQKDFPDKKIILNVNDYRQQRETKIKDMVSNIANRVLETGRSYTFSYLPPQERFIVHTTISENPDFADLESVSEGEGANRVLTIRLKS